MENTKLNGCKDACGDDDSALTESSAEMESLDMEEEMSEEVRARYLAMINATYAAFVNLVKEELDAEQLDVYVGIMKDCDKKSVDWRGTVERIEELFAGNEKLVTGFNRLMPKDCQIHVETPEDDIINEESDIFERKQEALLDDALRFIQKIQFDLKNKDRVLFRPILEMLSKSRAGKKPLEEIADEMSVLLENHPELLSEFNNLVAPYMKNIKKQERACKRDWNYKYNISERELSNCQRCTPSYLILPQKCVIPSSSHATKSDGAVLNDNFASFPCGTEGGSFKNRQTNAYEESMFTCEDDRFEFDMLLEAVNATIEHFDGLWENIHDDDMLGIHIRPKDCRCIVRLYGKYGHDVIDLLQENPCVVLPTILRRLKQRRHRLSNSIPDFNKAWSEVYFNYHHR